MTVHNKGEKKNQFDQSFTRELNVLKLRFNLKKNIRNNKKTIKILKLIKISIVSIRIFFF